MIARTTAIALACVVSSAASATAQTGFGEGGAIYDTHCASCHGLDGVPNLPGTPDFSRGESLLKSDAELIDSIRYGISSMPGFDHAIDREGLLDVVFYIRMLQR